MTGVCSCDCLLFSFIRPDFEQLLERSGTFARHIAGTLERPEVMSYLTEPERLLPAAVEAWVSSARLALRESRKLPEAVSIDRAVDSLLSLARNVRKFPVFPDLPEEEIKQIADRLIHSSYGDGHAYFQAGEEADRLFILEDGMVELLDPRHPHSAPKRISAGKAIGQLSFITNVDHTVTVVAQATCSGWAL